MKINCEVYAQRIKREVKAIPNKKALLILTAGYNPASESYVKGKLSDCAECDIPAIHTRVETQAELEAEIIKANADPAIAGIIVQLPLPEGFDEDRAVNLVADEKDVDGFKPNSKFDPCTPEGIIYIMKEMLGNRMPGANVLLVGRGKLVGKPLIEMLLREDCTLTICHSKTWEIKRYFKMYHDAVIVAVGREKLVDLSEVYADLVIDAGVNRNAEGKLCGDCYNHEAVDIYPLYTPVPKGIGLMTRAILMKHVAEASKGADNERREAD